MLWLLQISYLKCCLLREKDVFGQKLRLCWTIIYWELSFNTSSCYLTLLVMLILTSLVLVGLLSCEKEFKRKSQRSPTWRERWRCRWWLHRWLGWWPQPPSWCGLCCPPALRPGVIRNSEGIFQGQEPTNHYICMAGVCNVLSYVVLFVTSTLATLIL